MLVEFKVTNFRSIKDEQVLSLVATSDKTLNETNVYDTGIAAIPKVLKSAVVYGANASGKSNLLMAFECMRAVVLHSTRTRSEGDNFGVRPFLFEKKSSSSPTSFEVTVLLNGVRYEYGFSMTMERVTSEKLMVYKNFKPQQWFTRKFDKKTGKDIFVFKTGLRGPKQTWQSATKPESLFLTVATELNSEDIKPIFEWFAGGCVVLSDVQVPHPSYTAELVANGGKEETIRKFLKSADINIAGINVTWDEKVAQLGTIDPLSGRTSIVKDRKVKVPIITFDHSTEDDQVVDLKFEQESQGTRRMFSYAGPLMEVMNNNRLLVVDEFDSSIHPLLMVKLVKMFHDPVSNPGTGQLIFSTHDATLLSAYGLFRRDQIWFTDKGWDQCTTLTPLAKFKPRKTENIERYYLDDRYGGTPFLDTNLKLSD